MVETCKNCAYRKGQQNFLGLAWCTKKEELVFFDSPICNGSENLIDTKIHWITYGDINEKNKNILLAFDQEPKLDKNGIPKPDDPGNKDITCSMVEGIDLQGQSPIDLVGLIDFVKTVIPFHKTKGTRRLLKVTVDLIEQ